MVPDFSTLNRDEAEEWLRQELLYVDLVGQLSLERDDFHSLCELIQKKFVFGSTLLIRNVPHAIFVTSMVFTARYSDENVRKFWEPYGKLVWNLDEISQVRYKEFQDKFSKSVYFLENEYGLVFPRRSSGDVVRPIYRHAIIPFYLQDYFADWIKGRWRDILEIPSENLISQLRLDNSYRYLPPTLKTFIDGKNTEDTAKELLTTLATAASLYVQGEPLDNIDLLLATSPIHKSLWNELLKTFQEQNLEVETKQIQPVYEWVWVLEEHEMQLRVRNMAIQSTEQPDRFVWTERGESPADAAIESRVLPWYKNNEWLIDSSCIGLGPLDGQVVLLGEYGNILEAFPVPRLPEGQPIMAFRIAHQNVYGIPIDLSSNLISDGHWLISMTENVKILDANGRELLPTERLPVPSPLDHYGHKVAGIYNFKLPLTIKRNDLLIASIEKREQVGGQPYIVGSQTNTFKDLPDAVSPIFSDLDIWLVIPDAPKYIVNRGTLQLKNASSTELYRLKELVSRGFISFEDEALRIFIGSLLSDHLATYTVQIIIGLRPIFASPLEFSYLPNIEVVRPDPKIVYSPQRLPRIEIKGTSSESIKVRPGTTVTPDGDRIEVVWSDLRDDPKLNVVEGEERVSLEWKLQRVDAWISPEKDVYILDNFKNCEFQVFSTATSITSFRVLVDNNYPGRKVYLGKKGKYSALIKNDPIFDLVREKPAEELKLLIEMGSSSWELAEIHKKISLDGAEIKNRRTHDNIFFRFSCNLEQQWDGATKFTCSPLLDPSKEIILDESTYLGSEHLFKVHLPNGFYQLQISYEGKNLLNPPLIVSNVDKCDKKLEEYIGELQIYLIDKKLKKLLPPNLEEQYVAFLLAIYTDSLFENHPDFLCRLLTCNIQSLLQIKQTKLSEESPTVSALLKTITDHISEREDGLLPPWVVTDRPIYMQLLLPLKPLSIKIFPQYAENRAASGIGYTYLRVRGDSFGADPVFAKWDIRASDDRYDVLLGLPDNVNKRTYPKLNPELDIWPLRQCSHCGEIFVTYLIKEHEHGNIKPQLVDMTYDFDLIARLSVSNIHEELWYFEEPSHSVNRNAAIQIAEGNSSAQIFVPDNPISMENYLYSIGKTLERNSNDDAFYINEWLGVQSWQESFDCVESMLAENKVKIPAFNAAYRLIECLKPDHGNKWLNIDKQFLVLALLLRGQAHQQGQTLKLVNEIHLSIQDLIEMVEFAYEISPELLGWGLAWAEIFYIHTLC
jgi:hypothetical protein